MGNRQQDLRKLEVHTLEGVIPVLPISQSRLSSKQLQARRRHGAAALGARLRVAVPASKQQMINCYVLLQIHLSSDFTPGRL